MTTSVRGGHIDPSALPVSRRRSRTDGPARLVAHIARSLWLRDRATAELRWAGVTATAMAGLAITAKALDPADPGFDRAIVLFTPLALVLLGLGWSRFAGRLMALPRARLIPGPLLVLVAALAAGPADVHTLEIAPAAPLAWLALLYAAITPGFPIAIAIMLGRTVGVAIGHLMSPASVVGEPVIDEFVVGASVVYCAAAGIYVVVRVAAEAEARANRLAGNTRARADVLETIDRIDRRFDGSRPVRDVIQSVVEDVSEAFDIALVSLYLPTGDGRLTMVGVAGYPAPFHVIDIGLGVIGRAAATQATQFVPDVLADPDYRAARDDVRSEVAAPILHEDELLGVVNFEGTIEHPLTTAHVALAEMLARAIASSLRSARLDEERRERLHAIERVLEVSRGLVSDLDRGRTARAVVDAAADLLAAETVLIAARDPDGRYLVEHAVPQRGPLGRALGSDDPVALEAIRRAEPVMVEVERPTVALPIVIDDVVAAVLVAKRPAGAPTFGAMESLVADLLATQVAVALRNAERHAQMSDAAVRDPLTGLLNRRYFDEAVESAFATARRAGAALSLIVLDLDRFSSVNNEHGHAVGDGVLRRVALAMTASVRNGDIVARYGGEEFVVVAPGADTGEAVAVAERIRAAIALATVQDAEGRSVGVTASAGVASLLGDEVDGRALFRAADSALLAAKRAGRDRVVSV